MTRKWATTLHVTHRRYWMDESWRGVSSFWWEPHLGRMARWAIREQPFSFFLLSGHDYEKGTLWDNSPCIPCLAPIHKGGTLPSLQQHCSSVIRGDRGFTPDIVKESVQNIGCTWQEHSPPQSFPLGAAIRVATNYYFNYWLIVWPIKCLKKCPSQVSQALVDAFKCLVFSNQQFTLKENQQISTFDKMHFYLKDSFVIKIVVDWFTVIKKID